MTPTERLALGFDRFATTIEQLLAPRRPWNGSIGETTSIEDLDLDSFGLIELLLGLEDAYGTVVDDLSTERCETVGDLWTVVRAAPLRA